MKRIVAFLLIMALTFVFCSCSDNSAKNSSSSGTVSVNKSGIVLPEPRPVTSRTDDAAGFQLEAPEIGEKVVVLETTMGNIVIRMFPESAPKTVENFMTHADNGYYNGLIFHRVMNEFMIQGGDPKGNGTGGESIWGEDFEDEFNANLLNLRGSLAMANSGANTNGSQFFINQRTTATAESSIPFAAYFSQLATSTQDIQYLTEMYNNNLNGEKIEYATVEEFISNYIADYLASDYGVRMDPRRVPDEVWALYNKYGGNIELDGAWKSQRGHSVFGQVVIGMDVVDSIAAVETDSNDKPETDVVITKAYTTPFTEEMLSKVDSYIVK